MKPIVCALLQLVSTVIRSRLSLQLEIVALRHQLAVYQRTTKSPQISSGDSLIVVVANRGAADSAGFGNLPVTQVLVPFETQYLFDFSHG